jgi:hypothetical protein
MVLSTACKDQLHGHNEQVNRPRLAWMLVTDRSSYLWVFTRTVVARSFPLAHPAPHRSVSVPSPSRLRKRKARLPPTHRLRPCDPLQKPVMMPDNGEILNSMRASVRSSASCGRPSSSRDSAERSPRGLVSLHSAPLAARGKVLQCDH